MSKLSCLAEGFLRATPSLARGTPWAVTSQGRFPPAVLTGPFGRPARVRSSRTSFNLLHVRLQRTSHVSPAARRPCRPHPGGTRTVSGVFRRHGGRWNGDDLPNAPEGAPSRLPPVAGEAGGRPVQALGKFAVGRAPYGDATSDRSRSAARTFVVLIRLAVSLGCREKRRWKALGLRDFPKEEHVADCIG